jgi:protein ImuB
VLVSPGKGGQRIVCLNKAARAGGLCLGELLSNARSKVLDLQVCDAEPVADADALRKLALWAMQYAPLVTVWDEASSADGLFLDITGAAHLYGGEEPLLANLQHRLRSFGLYPRLAIAGTAGAAWALARYGKRNCMIIPTGSERGGLEHLPLAALRLPEEALAALRRLGFRRCGELIDQPRAPFGARFDARLLSRLDQALGKAPEPLIPVVPPPIYRAQAQFLEPILHQEQVLEAARHLLEKLVQDLARDAVGARLIRLLLFRPNGAAVALNLGLAAPSRDALHMAQLIGLRLYRLHFEFETDFGFEAAAVHVLSAEDMPDQQTRFAIGAHTPEPEELARLIDRLQHRLGAGAVRQLLAQQSHIPERAVGHRKGFIPKVSSSPSQARQRAQNALRAGKSSVLCAEAAGSLAWASNGPAGARPLLLLPRPEAADVVALVPEGPPRQFRWRGIRHQVAASDGPERIAPEWWHRTKEITRDYYVVEDTTGRRFWLFRAGLYDRETDTPQWFVHGVFG